MALYCADVPSTHRVLSLKSWRRVEYEEHYTPSTPWEKFGTGISHVQIYCIWQPGGWINIKHNKNKNYIIITQTIDRWAISDNYLGHKERRVSKGRQLCQPLARQKFKWAWDLKRGLKPWNYTLQCIRHLCRVPVLWVLLHALFFRCHETPHRVHRARCAASRHAWWVTGCFAPSSVFPFTYSTFPAYFPAYSVKTQAPSSGCFNYISARCGISRHPYFSYFLLRNLLCTMHVSYLAT